MWSLADFTRVALVASYAVLIVWGVWSAVHMHTRPYRVLSWGIVAASTTWVAFYAWAELVDPFDLGFAVQLSRMAQVPSIGLAVMLMSIMRIEERSVRLHIERIANGD